MDPSKILGSISSRIRNYKKYKKVPQGIFSDTSRYVIWSQLAQIWNFLTWVLVVQYFTHILVLARTYTIKELWLSLLIMYLYIYVCVHIRVLCCGFEVKGCGSNKIKLKFPTKQAQKL